MVVTLKYKVIHCYFHLHHGQGEYNDLSLYLICTNWWKNKLLNLIGVLIELTKGKKKFWKKNEKVPYQYQYIIEYVPFTWIRQQAKRLEHWGFEALIMLTSKTEECTICKQEELTKQCKPFVICFEWGKGDIYFIILMFICISE